MTKAAPPSSQTFKCECGKVEFKLKGDPYCISVCHCHSCVAAERFIHDELHNGTGTSRLTDGGVSGAFYDPNQVEFTKPLSQDMFGVVKVGPKGKPVRSYSKCCGTNTHTAHPKFLVVNLNCIHKEDGSKWEPAAPVVGTNKKYAFDPAEVSESAYSIAPFSIIFPVMSRFLNPFGPKLTEKSVFPDPNIVPDEVPITWE